MKNQIRDGAATLFLLLAGLGVGVRRRNHVSVAKFRTRRPSHIRKMPRCRAVLSEVRTLAWRDGTGWLGGGFELPNIVAKYPFEMSPFRTISAAPRRLSVTKGGYATAL